MPRHYTLELLNQIKEKQYYKVVDGVEVLVKPVPDAKGEGIMDPRVYKESKVERITQYFVPSRYPKVFNKLLSKRGLVEKEKASESIHNGVVLESVVDVEGCLMHIFRPTNKIMEAPVLYFLHGGGYWSGSTSMVADALRLLVSEYRCVVFSLDYRLAPQFPVPQGHLDAKVGLDWIFEHGASYGADLKEVFVGGDSAGANIAIYLSEDTRIRGQVLLYPTVNLGDYSLFDLNHYEINEKQQGVIKGSIRSFKKYLHLMEGIVDNKHEVLRPLQYEVKRQVPTFMALGAFDVLKFEGLAYARKLESKRVIIYEGLGHAFIDKVGMFPQSEDCVYEMGDFMRDVSHNL